MKKEVSWSYLIIIFISITLLLIAFTGCDTAKRAVKQTNKNIENHPLAVLPIFRGKFPCITTGTEHKVDSTDYKIWKDSVDKINAFYGDLLANIEPEIIHETDSSNCEEYKANAAKYKANDIKQKNIIALKDNQIAALNERVNNVKPVKDSVLSKIKDSAEIKELLLVIAAKDKDNQKLGQKLESKEKTLAWYKKGFFIYSFIALAIAIFFGVRLYSKLTIKKLLP